MLRRAKCLLFRWVISGGIEKGRSRERGTARKNAFERSAGLFAGAELVVELLVLVEEAFHHEGEGAVAGDVAGGAEAVLQGEDGQHESGAVLTEQQHTGDQAQRGHDSTAGNTGSANGKDAQQQAEQDHGANGGDLAIQTNTVLRLDFARRISLEAHSLT